MNDEFSSKTIYIIDDEIDILEALTAVIHIHLNVNIITFNSSLEALEKIRAGEVPNLIISDIKMPKMDGLQFVEEIKKLNIKKPVIIMSAHANKKEAIQSLQLGVYGLLDKPLSYELLIHEITRALNLEEYHLISEKLKSEKDLLIDLLQKSIAKNHERISNVENLLLNEDEVIFKDKDKMKSFLTNINESNKIDGEVSKVYQTVNELIAKQEAYMCYAT